MELPEDIRRKIEKSGNQDISESIADRRGQDHS